MKTPTYEEFEKAVTYYFKDGWKTLSDEQVMEYIKSEEAQEAIREKYADDVSAYESGKITRRQFMVGGASAVGNCLVYMY
jgi:hypothetical protein